MRRFSSLPLRADFVRQKAVPSALGDGLPSLFVGLTVPSIRLGIADFRLR